MENYVAILMKIYLTQFMIGCFIVGFPPFGVNGTPFFCVVQRCSIISLMGSLDEIILNLQLHRKIYLFYDGLWVVNLFICLVCSCITYVLERTWWMLLLVSCLMYISCCLCRICTIL